MKNFILGFVAALISVALIYFGYPLVSGFFGGRMPVSPEELNLGVKDYGTLRIEVFGKGQPIVGVAVDLGKIGPKGPTGPMSELQTDERGVALFEKVPVGTYDIFWNSNDFPAGEFSQPARIQVDILKSQIVAKRIDLTPLK